MQNEKSSKKKGKVIAFYNRKGGVGKTTLSGNFAAFLAKMIRKEGGVVMYLDLDSQVNAATTYLGLDREELSKPASDYPNMLNLVGIDAPSLNVKIPKLPLQTLVQMTNLNLRTIAPSDQMELYWKKTPAYVDDWTIFKNPFEELRDNYDYIILDLPPAQDDMTYSALAASDYLIIPAECDVSSIANLEYFVRDVVPLFQDINPSFQILGIVANKFDRYSDSFYENALKDAAKKCGIRLYSTKVRASSGLKDPNDTYVKHKKSLRARSSLNRCVVAYDDFIFKTYPKAYEDIKKFTEETLSQIKKMEDKK